MTATDILREVARKHQVNVEDMRGACKSLQLVIARAEFIRRCVAERDLNDKQIGFVINRDRKTVRYHRCEVYRAAQNARSLRWHAKQAAR